MLFLLEGLSFKLIVKNTFYYSTYCIMKKLAQIRKDAKTNLLTPQQNKKIKGGAIIVDLNDWS